MTLSDPTPTDLNSPANASLWTQFRATLRRWFASPSPTSASDFSFEPSEEEEGSFVVAPCGYRIRVPRSDDVHRSVGEILPSVREGLELVPPLPHAVVELLKEIQNPTASSASVAQIAASDPAMAASLIRAVNAASMGMSRKITSVPEAVSYLGFSSVKSLLLRLNLDKTLASKSAATDDVSDLWVHSLMVSYIAESLARRVPGVDAGFVSTFALLHDIGKLIIQSQFPEEAKALRASIAAGGRESLLEQEARILGADHAALGAQLASNWKLPADLVQAIRWHHVPVRAFEPGDPKPLHQAMYLVQIANQLAKYCYVYDDHMEFDAISDAAYQSLDIATNLTALLDTGVCAAASRAIFLSEEGRDRSPDSRRRFLHLHRGEEAARFLDSLDSSTPGTHQVDVDNDLCQSLFDSKIAGDSALSQPATSEGVQKLCAEVQARLDAVESSADDRLALSLVTKCILAGAIGCEDAKLEASVRLDAGRTRLAFRSPGLSFANRFAPAFDADAALLALESELANVLNLNWFDSILTSTDGSILTFTTRAA
jgi:putative nucleotidyltransferase with HDIG domain